MSDSQRKASVCPHDCPSTCSLEIEVLGPDRIGAVRGAKSNAYTAGVICAKVARYAERVHSPDRLLFPLRRTGPKGLGQFERIGWDEALDIVAEKFKEAERLHGAQAVWPYYYAGTMGHVMRSCINGLRHAKKYSGQFSTICTTLAWTGFQAGTGAIRGADPREMAQSDCVVIWGTNAVHTQVNVMTHAIKARKERGAKIVVIDIYNNATMQQADMPLLIRPGTDGALACAVMHVLFRDGLADWDYLNRYTDCPREFEVHLKSKTPQWAEAITGLPAAEIEAFAHLVGHTKRSFFRLGYGFARQRNGAVNMHAASCIPAVTGAWAFEGGGAFFNNGSLYHWNKEAVEHNALRDPAVRMLDMSQIGRVLTGDAEALRHGPPVMALLIQNTNPLSVAPEQILVKRGFARDDLFTCVHEQFMTETARMADIVLPATMFVEHDDLYSAGGQQTIQFGPKLIDAPGECRSNLEVIRGLSERLGVALDGFEQSSRQLSDRILQESGWGSLEALERETHKDIQIPFREAHYLDGFANPDGKFRFRPDWQDVGITNIGLTGPWQDIPAMPDHWAVIEEATEQHPFRLATSPARNFLNSTFTETLTSCAKEGDFPQVLIHPEDAEKLQVAEGDWLSLFNDRGDVHIRAKLYEGVRRGVLIAEGIWPNSAHPYGQGINTLTGADTPAPYGGAAFHDNRVGVRTCSEFESQCFSEHQKSKAGQTYIAFQAKIAAESALISQRRALRDHIYEEFLAKYGLPASPKHRNEIRKLLVDEIDFAHRWEDGENILRVLCLQLFSIGIAEDALVIWQAKRSNWDANSSVDVQFLCGAGLQETKDFLRTSDEADAQDALEYIEACEETGDFDNFCREERILYYRRYLELDYEISI